MRYISLYLSISLVLSRCAACVRVQSSEAGTKIFASLVLGKERKNHPSQFRVTIFRV